MAGKREKELLRVKSNILWRMVENARKYQEDTVGDIYASIRSFDEFRDRKYDRTWPAHLDKNVCVQKVAQYKRTFGSWLYNTNPSVRVIPENYASADDESRAPIEQDYLTICMEQTDFFEKTSRIIDDSFMAYGVAWPTFDKHDERLVTIEVGNSKDTWFDPDVELWSDVQYTVRRRRGPKWLLAEQFKKYRKEIYSICGTKKTTQNDYSESMDDESPNDNMVDYYEVYLLTNLRNYADNPGDRKKLKDQTGDPQRFVIADEGRLLLEEDDWPLPLHMIRNLPCFVLQYQGRSGNIYPRAPLEPGLPWLQTMDRAAATLVSQYQIFVKKIVAYVKGNGGRIDQKDLQAALNSNRIMEAVEIIAGDTSHAANPMSVNQILQELDINLPDFEKQVQYFNWLEQQFEHHTGFNNFLMSGSGEKQDRSARATMARENMSQSPMRYMGNCIDKWFSDVMASLRLAARILVSPDEIGEILGSEAKQIWGTLMPKEKDLHYWTQYWLNEGEQPEQAQQIAQETVQGTVDLKTWLSSSRVSVVVGSRVRQDREEEKQYIQETSNQLIPALAQSGQSGAAAFWIAKLAEVHGLPEAQVRVILENGQMAEQMQRMQMQMQAMQMQMQMMAMMNPQPQPAALPQPEQQDQQTQAV